MLALSICAPARAVTPGQPAPELVGRTLDDGREIRLSAYRGKVVYLDFWANWCAPCRLSLPRLEQMREELAPLGFEVIGVNLDDDEAQARAAAQSAGVRYPVVRGVDPKTVTEYAIIKMPGAYLIDRDGIVRYSYQGFSAGGFAQVRPIAAALAGGKPAK